MIRSVITATAAIATAACMVAAASPAFAQSATPHMTYDTKSNEFCTDAETVTGSLIPVTECHSASTWAELGLTVRFDNRAAQR